MARKTKTKSRATKKNVKLIPRGVRPPTSGYRANGSIMKNGGKK